MQQQQPQRNPWICLTIVGLLGAVALVCVGGIIAASLRGVTPDNTLSFTLGTCIGSLSSFLVNVPRGSVGVPEPQPLGPPPPPAAAAAQRAAGEVRP